MTPRVFAGWRFDGRSAEALPVALRVEGTTLVVESAAGELLDRAPLASASFSDPSDHAPGLVQLAGGATLQVTDGVAFSGALAAAGVRRGVGVRLQQWWPAVVAALGVIVASLGAAYVYGLPAAADWVARSVPPSVERSLGEEVLSALDRAYLEPSTLGEPERTAIAERFAGAARRVAPDVTYRLEFRAVGDAVNAMALPGGIIVLLDGLVEAAGDPDEVLAVLGHELGHVFHRHPFRDMLQALGVGTLAGLAWGDFSGVAAAAPAVIGLLRYSRDFEREADEYALRFLAENGLDRRPLHAFFESLGALERELGVDEIPEFLSTHPNTAERLERARLGVAGEEADAPGTGGSRGP